MPRAGGKPKSGSPTARNVPTVQSTNDTTHYFIGAPQRSWMNSATDHSSSSTSTVARPTSKRSNTISERPRSGVSNGILVTTASKDAAAGHVEANFDSLPTSNEISSLPTNIGAIQRERQQIQAGESTVHIQAGPGPGMNNASESASANANANVNAHPEAQPPQQAAQVPSPPSNTQPDQPLRFEEPHKGLEHNPAHALSQQSPPADHTDILPSSIQSLQTHRKRPSDAEPDSRRGKRMMNDQIAGPAQLPTPHSSPTVSTINALITRLDLAIRALNRPFNLVSPSNLDEHRLSTLREACLKNDVFFVFTHLIYCNWSAGQHTELVDLTLTREHSVGMQILSTILGSNYQLSWGVNQLLCNFPSTAHVYIREWLRDREKVGFDLPKNMKTFLSWLATGYEQVKHNFVHLAIPPIPLDLQLQLLLPSKVLLGAIFRSIIRHGVTDENYVKRAWIFFQGLMDLPNNHSMARPDSAHASAERATVADMFRAYQSVFDEYYAAEANRRVYQDSQAVGHQTWMIPPALPGQRAVAGGGAVHVLSSTPLRAPGQPRQFVSQAQQPQMIPQTTMYPGSGGQKASIQPDFPSTLIGQRPIQSGFVPNPPRSRGARAPLPLGRGVAAQSVGLPHSASRVSLQQSAAIGQPQPTAVQRVQSVRRAQATIPAQVLPTQAVPSPQTPNASRSPAPALFPPAQFVLPTLARPDPDKHALHQAHLRSPKYNKIAYLGGTSDSRYYQHVVDIVRMPQTISANSDLVQWIAHIDPYLWDSKAKTLKPSGEFLTRRRSIWNGCVQFRLKCVAVDEGPGTSSLTLSEFCVQSTKWPQYLAVSINGDMGVDFRRKAHHGTDIPTDVTDLLRAGDNEVSIAISSTSAGPQQTYLMAIEVVVVSDREHLLGFVGRSAPQESLSSIVAALKGQKDGNTNDDDEDIIIAQPVLSIDLVDPFTSVMWVTPVRGKECQHRECFDLDSFLLSRTCRDPGSGVTNPDLWKCPICNKDARPLMLTIDRFLLEVRKTLEQRNQVEGARAILVKEDGSWEVKLSPDRAVSVAASSSSGPSDTSATQTPAPTSGVRQEDQPTGKSQDSPAAAKHATTPSASKDLTPIIVLDDGDEDENGGDDAVL
ncbi:hypothetical protein A1O1_06169 [Capronia coronata CBS 617.96]|uniref:SP-RING-type domain-containing protein n=1 Tax=Capronia coronata CBS 617.96 TaxID=1182541 RepID=W9Y840_9EURO|nr:uncharacterized protein A1O1_06169 [Capronia coronata CBS 617.96]EXJ85800.1 hypothetical protein A1O1_06169 [Capronia coronata CBS 617.96]